MYFYKQMCGFYMGSVCLPEQLTTQFAPLIDQFIELKLPNGASWRVGLVKCGSKLALQDGWFEFARQNSISQNDLLVFKFKGGSEFEVVIFDSDGLEKSIGGDEIKKEIEEFEEPIEVLEEPIEELEGPIEENYGNNHELMQFSSSEAENFEGNSNNSDLNEIEEDFEDEGEGGKNRYKKFVRFYPKDGVVAYFHDFYSPQGLHLTKEEIKKAKELSKEIKEGNPTFMQILKPAHITSRFSLSVPRHFCTEFLPKERQNISLRRFNKKKKWTARCNYNKKHHEIRWIEFVRENNLSEGDICLFELDKNEPKLTFIVHVTRL
ncbi:hypothetical protein LUZ60_004981 [Juncus effusus]|nr:hypothetical protein LUZ60_004981 [Juncus effusus]